MAGKNLPSSEAAAKLGVTEDQLNLMRQRGEIFAVRTGTSWEYKPEEIERVLAERAGGSGVLNADDFDGLLADLSSPTQPADGSEAILVSEEALGRSPEGTSSTIIGKKEGPATSEDSDLQLAPESDLPGSAIQTSSGILGGSDLNLSGSGTGSIKKEGSDLELGDGLKLDDDDELVLAPDPDASQPAQPVSSGESDLKLAMDDLAVEAKPADDDSDEIDLDSDNIGLGTGSVIGSGVGSDVTLRAGDSGINLKPTDSGLSLEEEPLDLGGSAVDSLELPEDDEVIALDEEAADPDQATQLKQDDQFLLSPSALAGDDDSDSGSQVIALEDSESFDSDAATMLRSGPAPLTEDAFAAVPMMEAFPADADPMGGVAGGIAAPGATGQPVYVQVPVMETPYSVWNVLGLFLVAIMMACCAMLTIDILLNMWVFDEQRTISMGLMNMMIETFQLDK
jgi:hypothetical protein